MGIQHLSAIIIDADVILQVLMLSEVHCLAWLRIGLSYSMTHGALVMKVP